MSFSVADSRESSIPNDDSSISETTMCGCWENQLGHYDWNGVQRNDLPEICMRTIRLTSEKDDGANTSVTESDPEWENGKTHIFCCTKS
jgi:hypothetical protein